MLLAELNGLKAVLLHLSGIILVAARLAHAKGFIDARGKGSTARFYGILVTWLLILALAIANIALGWLR